MSNIRLTCPVRVQTLQSNAEKKVFPQLKSFHGERNTSIYPVPNFAPIRRQSLLAISSELKKPPPSFLVRKAAASSSAYLDLLIDGSLVKLGDGIGRPGKGGFLSCLSLIAYLLCAPLIALDRRGLCSSIALDRAADLSFAFANRDDPVGPRGADWGRSPRLCLFAEGENVLCDGG